MSVNAQEIQFGTETYATGGVWPATGSGQWPDQGWSYAAYQRNLSYSSTDGQAIPDTLSPYQPAASCYTTSDPMTDDSGSVFFYVGGPGGSGC